MGEPFVSQEVTVGYVQVAKTTQQGQIVVDKRVEWFIVTLIQPTRHGAGETRAPQSDCPLAGHHA